MTKKTSKKTLKKKIDQGKLGEKETPIVEKEEIKKEAVKEVKKIEKEVKPVEVKKPTIKELEAKNQELQEELDNLTPPDIGRVREDNTRKLKEAIKTKGIEEGRKRPSITDMRQVHTKAEYQKIIDRYKIQNPVKYASKRSELERKLRKAR